MSGHKAATWMGFGRVRAALRSSRVRVASFGVVAMLIMLSMLSIAGLACGSDDAAPAKSAASRSPDAGVGTRTSGQQSGRSNPTAGNAGSSVSMLQAATLPSTVSCGETECAPPKNIAAQLLMSITGLPRTGADTVACCLDEAAGTCSSAAAVGASCDVIAVSDERCPGVDLSALAGLVGGLEDSTQQAKIGCCTHGACGLDGKLFGRGCVENAEAKRMLSSVPVIGPLISVPAPRPCAQAEEPAAMTDSDAGV